MENEKQTETETRDVEDEEEELTMVDVLQRQQNFEEDAAAVLGASDPNNCTYSQGYVKRQALYACLTCTPDAESGVQRRAGVCLACSLSCHDNHNVVELYTKRHFRCDCGGPKYPGGVCSFNGRVSKTNMDNKYNHNFAGLYCTCRRPYPDPENPEEDEMIQCVVCEDWLHAKHLNAKIPPPDRYSEMICQNCMVANTFLSSYVSFEVNADEDNDQSVIDRTVDISVSESENLNNTRNEEKALAENENTLEENDNRDSAKTDIGSEVANEAMETETVENKTVENGSEDKVVPETENQTVPNETENIVIANEAENQTVPNKTENMNAVNETENQTTTSETENQTVPNKTENMNVVNEIENQIVMNESENQTVPNETENQIVRNENENETVPCESDQTISSEEVKVENDVSMNEIESEVKTEKRKLDDNETIDRKRIKLSDCQRPSGDTVIDRATFWPGEWRSKLCPCSECMNIYTKNEVLFLLDNDDTVMAYELLGKNRTESIPSQYEEGLAALSSLGHVQQINAITEYNKMKTELFEFLQTLKNRKEVVKEEDIKRFFAGMRPNRDPDGVYFCK